MDFQLDDDQRAFAASVHDLLADRFDLGAVRAVVDDPDGDGHPAELWVTMAAQGWLSVTVPIAQEGLGLGLVDAQIVARALGAGAIPGPWRASTLAVEAIRTAGRLADRTRWLPGLGSGATVGTHALDQPIPFSPDATGVLVRVEYAAVADLLVISDGTDLGVVDLHGPGVTITPTRQYDATTRLAAVALDGAPVVRLGPVGDLGQRAAVLTAADLVGISRTALTRTVAYDSQRVQFGHPVGSFQAIKHELANLHVATTMAEWAVLYAAHALDAARPDVDLAVAVAKSKASETALLVTAAMIQFHGGIGFTWEHDAHFFFKRAKRLAATSGNAAAHRERIAQLLLDR